MNAYFYSTGKEAKQWRTSSTYFLRTEDDKTLETLDDRTQWLLKVPLSHAEYIQASNASYVNAHTCITVLIFRFLFAIMIECVCYLQ